MAFRRGPGPSVSITQPGLHHNPHRLHVTIVQSNEICGPHQLRSSIIRTRSGRLFPEQSWTWSTTWRAVKSGELQSGVRPKNRKYREENREQAKPIELYYWPTPNGSKISIMLEECGLPYVLKPVNISKGEQFNPDFLKIAPNNRMPAIVDPQGPGGRPISIFESGAILQYLGRKTGKFYPSDERARVEVDQWLFWQMGGLGPMA